MVSQRSCCPRGPERSAGPTWCAQLLSDLLCREIALATVWKGPWVWDRPEAEGQDETSDLEDRGEGKSLRCLRAGVMGLGALLGVGR